MAPHNYFKLSIATIQLKAGGGGRRGGGELSQTLRNSTRGPKSIRKLWVGIKKPSANWPSIKIYDDAMDSVFERIFNPVQCEYL